MTIHVSKRTGLVDLVRSCTPREGDLLLSVHGAATVAVVDFVVGWTTRLGEGKVVDAGGDIRCCCRD